MPHCYWQPTSESPDVGAAAADVSLLQIDQSQPLDQEGRLRGPQVARVQPESWPHPRTVRITAIQCLWREDNRGPQYAQFGFSAQTSR